MIWTYKGEEVWDVPEGTYGFIYQIVYTDGKKYIGKKNCYSFTKKYLTKNSKIQVTNSFKKDITYLLFSLKNTLPELISSKRPSLKDRSPSVFQLYARLPYIENLPS